MIAVTLDSFDVAPGLHEDLPEPEIADDQVLVRVRASSVNPVDVFIASGALKGMAEYEFPVVLGRDYAGVVEHVGAAVTSYAPGDEVFGFLTHANPAVHDGTWAELIVVGEDRSIAPKPANVGVSEAGAAPLAGITALAAYDALDLSRGDTLLVMGATGGVGSIAVQLAADLGVQVIASALPEDEEYLRGLGVIEILDRNADVVAAVRERHPDGVDALLDVVSPTPEALNAFAAALRDGGRVVSSVGAAGDGPGRTNAMAVPSPENLERLAGLLDNATVAVPIQATYPLEQAVEALNTFPTQHTQGKLAISVP
jgi:NADPH2:quinone reductase